MKQKINISIFAFAMLTVGLFFGVDVGNASAATYYVRQSGSVPAAPYDNWNKAAPGFSTISASLVDGDVVVYAAGTYSTTANYGRNFGPASITIRAANETLDSGIMGWNSSFGIGRPIFDMLAANEHLMYFTTAGKTITLRGLTLKNARYNDSKRAINMTVSVTLNLEDIVIEDSAVPFFSIAQVNVTSNNVTIKGGYFGPNSLLVSDSAGSSYTFTKSKFIPSALSPIGPMQISTVAGASLSVQNSFFSGIRDRCIKFLKAGTLTFKNNIVLAPVAGVNPVFSLGTGSDTPTVYESNNIITYNPVNYTQDPFSPLIKDSSDITSDPLLNVSSGLGYLGINVDDGVSLAYAEQVAEKVAAYGYNITFQVSQQQIMLQNDYVARLQSFVNAGNDIMAHAYSDSDLTAAGPIDVGGPQAGSALTVTAGPGEIQLKNDGVNVDYTFAIGVDGTTVVELVSWISSKPGWTVRKYNGSTTAVDDYALLSGLNPITTVVSNGLWTNISWLLDVTANTGHYLNELKNPQAWLQNIIRTGAAPGSRAESYEIKYFAYPKGLHNKTLIDAVASVYLGARSFSSGSDTYSLWMQNSLGQAEGNIYRLGAISHSPGFVGLNEVQTKINASLLAQRAIQGSFNFAVGHNAGQISITQIGYIMESWLSYIPSGLNIVTVNSLLDIFTSPSSSWGYKEVDAVNGGKMWGLKSGSTLSSSFDISGLQSLSPAIDSGATTSLTTDFLGNPIYGLPDIGAYEYQPPYAMGTDEMDITANVRVYGDGKFRNTGTVGGTTVDLSVIPQSSQTTKWLDISKADDESAIVWETNHKKWKESSATLGATNTLHTIGDLIAGKSYSLRIDNVLATSNITGTDCADGVCTADGTGKITFTYTGGYSEHTFDLDDDISPVISITSPESGSTVSGDDTITFTDSEQTDPECSVDNATWINCVNGVTSFSELTNWDNIEESDTFTLYMRDADSSGNVGSTSVANLVKADIQAPVRSSGSPSGELVSSSTSTVLRVTTNEASTCRYSNTLGIAYADMSGSFETSSGTTHTADITGLQSGQSYAYYIKCQDGLLNVNDTDYLINFSVAAVQIDNDDDNDNEDDEDEKDLNVHNVKAQSTENTVTITWKTDHKTKSVIRYGTNNNLEEKKKDNDKEKTHETTLKDLLPDTKYYFRVKAEDGDGNEESSKIHSVKTEPLAKGSEENMDGQSIKDTDSVSEKTPNPTAYVPSVSTHTVQSGDTLWSIAKKVYGDATAYTLIIEKNKDKYPDIESKLSIGQQLSFENDNEQPKQDTESDSSLDAIDQKQSESETSDAEFRWWNPLSWF